MKRIILGGLILVCALTTHAQEGFYGTIGVGFVVPSKTIRVLDNSSFVIYGPTAAPSGVSIFNLPNVNWENKFRPGFNASAAAGYHFTSHWRGDIEFIYQRIKRKVTGTYDFIEYDAVNLSVIDFANGIQMAPSSGHANIYSLLTNGYYDFVGFGKFKPFLGGGFGIAWVDACSTSVYGSFRTNLGSRPTTFQHSPKLSGTAFALQFKTGVTYAWRKSTAIALQYRLFWTSNFIANKSSIITNPTAGPSTRHFFVSEQTISGLLTNSIDVIFTFKL